MIDKKFLQGLATKKQVGLENIMREYAQNLFLSYFYTLKTSENILFKGGSALKLVFESPRYSEDLDFTGLKNNRLYENLLEQVMLYLANRGIKLDLVESKETSGGHLSILKVNILDKTFEIKNEISFRKKESIKREAVIINPEYIPAYSAYILRPLQLVGEKVQALITRSKPRDFFDLYFILRTKILRKQLRLNENQREKILKILKEQDKKMLKKDLQDLLPRSFWPTISNLPLFLQRELQ